ncbi:Otogelin [Orchesella cincta]|uniref:Otogelin n=1 Tax=Orchesella cincta TaxID=48709 RepID=A0A1D2M117_ORCCI|nr:Otogelin [Orchesella cincta]
MKVAIVVLIIAAAVAMPGPNNPSETSSKAVAEIAATGNNAELGTTGTSTPIQAASENAPAKETTIDGATSETAEQAVSPAEALNSDAAEISSGASTVEGGEAQTVNQEAVATSIFHHKGNNATESEDGKPQGRHFLSFLESGQRNRFG